MRPANRSVEGTVFFYWCCSALFVATIIYSWVQKDPGESVRDGVLLTGLLLGISGLCATLAVRLPRAGLLMGPRGVVVRNPLRTWKLGLDEVTGFEPGLLKPGIWSTAGIRLNRRRGQVPILSMKGIAGPRNRDIETAFAEWQPICDRLNDLLGSLKGMVGLAEGESFS